MDSLKGFKGTPGDSVGHTLKITAKSILIIVLFFFLLHSVCIRDYKHTENMTVEFFLHNPLSGGRVGNEM